MTPSIGRSTTRRTQSGKICRWPDRDDYARHFVELGELDDATDFEDASHLHAHAMINWLARAQTGCRFASHLARSPEDSGWQAASFLPEAVAGGDIGNLADRVLNEFFDGAELVLLMFPSVNHVDDVLALLSDLAAADTWSVESIPDPTGTADLAGLRWLLPTGTHSAWVVGFAPSPEMPFTRRGPITTIAVRTSVIKRTSFSPTDDGLIPVHLADISHGLSQEQHEALNRSTIEARNDYLDGEHVDGARARVSFRLPLGSLERAGLLT